MCGHWRFLGCTEPSSLTQPPALVPWQCCWVPALTEWAAAGASELFAQTHHLAISHLVCGIHQAAEQSLSCLTQMLGYSGYFIHFAQEISLEQQLVPVTIVLPDLIFQSRKSLPFIHCFRTQTS